MKKKIVILSIIIISAVSVSIYAYSRISTMEILGYQVGTEQYTETVSAIGYVDYAGEIVVKAEAAGTVKSMDIQSGDRVSFDEQLLLIDNASALLDYEALEASLAVYEARLEDYSAGYRNAYSSTARQSAVYEEEKNSLLLQLESLDKDMENIRILVEEGIEPPSLLQTYEDEKAALNQSLSTVDARRKALAYPVYADGELKAALSTASVQLRQQEEALKKYTVTSPIDGIVLESYVDAGESVNIGDSLFKIASDSRKYAVVDVDEKYLSSLSVGKTVIVSSSLSASQSDKGVISQISPEVDYETGTIEIKVEILDNKDQYVKNMTVRILITTASIENALVIPQRYLVNDSGLFVMGVDGSNRTVKKPVSVYNTNVENVHITEGLSSGDIILDPAGLEEGTAVTIVLEGDDSL